MLIISNYVQFTLSCFAQGFTRVRKHAVSIIITDNAPVKDSQSVRLISRE